MSIFSWDFRKHMHCVILETSPFIKTFVSCIKESISIISWIKVFFNL